VKRRHAAIPSVKHYELYTLRKVTIKNNGLDDNISAIEALLSIGLLARIARLIIIVE
jgi:hypothetical protein